MAKKNHVPGPADIRLFSIADGKDRILTLKDWSGISGFDWAADGRTIWVTASPPAGVQTLLNVDLRGRAKPFLQEKDLGWAIPSPDGRHLAIWEASANSNALAPRRLLTHQPLSFRAKQADFFFRFRSCESVGLRSRGISPLFVTARFRLILSLVAPAAFA